MEPNLEDVGTTAPSSQSASASLPSSPSQHSLPGSVQQPQQQATPVVKANSDQAAQKWMAENASSEYANSCPPTPHGSVAPPSTQKAATIATSASMAPSSSCPPSPQGSVDPPSTAPGSAAGDAVQAVDAEAVAALGGRAAAWQRCKRIYADANAPPLLKQRWEEAQASKKAKKRSLLDIRVLRRERWKAALLGEAKVEHAARGRG